MTTVITSFIAIILFGMVMIATINYSDPVGMMSAPDSVLVAQRLQSAAALSSQIQADKGSRPRSVAELEAEGMPAPVVHNMGDLEISCSDEACSVQAVCMVMSSSSGNALVAKSVASRVKGIVSGQCGSETSPVVNQVVVTMWI